VSEPTVATLEAITDAFNRHDLDATMAFFTDDAVFLSPRGPEPFGRRFEGKDAVREGLAARVSGIPDVHYGDDDQFVAGDRGASEWTLTGTTTDGVRLEVRGCDPVDLPRRPRREEGLVLEDRRTPAGPMKPRA
jgi:ketosteroid isomerase-like protein